VAGVFRAGSLVWSEAIGLADVEAAEEATVDTQFAVASITTTFTAASLMQLRAEGKLDLADPLERHLPEASQVGPLTLGEMLAHTSGLQREPPGEIWESLDFPDADELLARPRRRARSRASGRGVAPPNLAYALL
jgi:CubicO group peptidase (beta-lactamase class C family)